MNSTVQQGATALLGVSFLFVLLLVGRGWTRRIARRAELRGCSRRANLTAQILRGVTWRMALLVFIGTPALLAFAGGTPESAARLAGGGLGMGIVLFPFVVFSLWQVARRISAGTFRAQRIEAHGAAVDSAESPSSDSIRAGLAHWRLAPTVVEGITLACVAVAALGLWRAQVLPQKKPLLAQSAFSAVTPVPFRPARSLKENSIPFSLPQEAIDEAAKDQSRTEQYIQRVERRLPRGASVLRLFEEQMRAHERALNDLVAATSEFIALVEGAGGKSLNRRNRFLSLCRRMKTGGAAVCATLEAYHGAQIAAYKAEPRYSEAERTAIQSRLQISYDLGRVWGQKAAVVGEAGEAWIKADGMGLGLVGSEEEEFTARWNAFAEAHSAFVERAKAVQEESARLQKK